LTENYRFLRWQIKKHCGNPINAGAGPVVQDKGHVRQCLIDHVASKDITEEKNSKCFKVSILIASLK
jgi:hypothetical protein